MCVYIYIYICMCVYIYAYIYPSICIYICGRHLVSSCDRDVGSGPRVHREDNARVRVVRDPVHHVAVVHLPFGGGDEYITYKTVKTRFWLLCIFLRQDQMAFM